MITLAGIDDNLVGVLFFVCSAAVGLAAIIAGSVKSASKTRQVEQTRREIAAYVAEGSMTPEDAVRILNAGSDAAAKQQIARGVTRGVAWGRISPEQAERTLHPEQREA